MKPGPFDGFYASTECLCGRKAVRVWSEHMVGRQGRNVGYSLASLRYSLKWLRLTLNLLYSQGQPRSCNPPSPPEGYDFKYALPPCFFLQGWANALSAEFHICNMCITFSKTELMQRRKLFLVSVKSLILAHSVHSSIHRVRKRSPARALSHTPPLLAHSAEPRASGNTI